MVDMTEEELRKAYKHCESMLYSDNYEILDDEFCWNRLKTKELDAMLSYS